MKLPKKIIAATLILTGLTLGGVAIYRNVLRPASKLAVRSNSAPAMITPKSDPTSHDTFDVEFTKKLILYHQLAAQLDTYAVNNALKPEVRQFAADNGTYNTNQANIYAGILTNWGVSYTSIEDLPKVPGGSCAGYPTFPGMLPHADVNAFLKVGPEELDKQFLALMAEHHSGINMIVKGEGSFINYGELISMRDAFYKINDDEVKQMEQMQKQLGFS